jgi:hypothetical protein
MADAFSKTFTKELSQVYSKKDAVTCAYHHSFYKEQ